MLKSRNRLMCNLFLLSMEDKMSTKLAIAAGLSLLIGSSTGLLAQSNSSQPPGQAMQEKGSIRGQPGASGYSPGREMQERGRRARRPGALGEAPRRTGYRDRYDRDSDEMRRSRGSYDRERRDDRTMRR